MVFDSGLGGLTVLAALRRAEPALNCIYVADDAGFPYGEFTDDELTCHVLATISGLIDRYRPLMVVVACNSASTLVLAPLRAQFDLPFVGTVPAIKPAAALTRTGLVSVLATPGTVQRDYTRGLIAEHGGDASVTLVGCRNLARLAEARMMGGSSQLSAIAREIAPAFIRKGQAKTDQVVLACTHYPLLADALAAAAPWPVSWIDPAPAIARRAIEVLGHEADAGSCRFITTSGANIDQLAGAVLERLIDSGHAGR